MTPVPAIPPGLYRGTVEGSESGRCSARLAVAVIPGGLVVDYEAVGAAGVQHVEHTLVMPGRLFVVHSEGDGVAEMAEAGPGVYEAVPDPYPMRIAIGWDGTTLTWAWSWGQPGEQLVERSRASVVRV